MGKGNKKYLQEASHSHVRLNMTVFNLHEKHASYVKIKNLKTWQNCLWKAVTSSRET